jgi:uncharacterized protein (UPF0333 family)
MDKQGQISAEYILIIGFALIIILVVVAQISNQSEENAVVSAVRTGASDTLTEEVMLNRSLQPVRVTSVNMNSGTNINITIQLSNNTVPDSLKMTILSGSKQSLEEIGYAPNPSSSISSMNFTLTTNNHQYFVRVA